MATSRLGPNSARQLALPQRLSIPNSKIPSHGGHGDRPVEFHTFPIRCVQTPLGTSIGIIGKDISWAKPMVAAGGSTAWITCTTRASSHLVPSWYIGDQDAKADAADAVAKPAKPCQSDFGSLASEFLHVFPSWQVRLGHGPILLHSGSFQQMWCPFLFFLLDVTYWLVSWGSPCAAQPVNSVRLGHAQSMKDCLFQVATGFTLPWWTGNKDPPFQHMNSINWPSGVHVWTIRTSHRELSEPWSV